MNHSTFTASYMNIRNIVIVVAFTGLMFCVLGWTGARLSHYPAESDWTWRIASAVCLAATLWGFLHKDGAKDFLRELGLESYERNGLGFAVLPAVQHHDVEFTVILQNRCSRSCTAKILLKIESGHDGAFTDFVTLDVACDGAGTSKILTKWPVPPGAFGSTVTCGVAADVDYPNGKGRIVRTKRGTDAGSIYHLRNRDPFDMLDTVAEFRLVLPIRRSELEPPLQIPSTGTAELNTEQSDTALHEATAEARTTVTDQRIVMVSCERCGRKYRYRLSRVHTATGTAPTRDAAQIWATVEANQQMANILRDASDVVPCPNCGAITRRMKREKLRNRMNAAKLALAGMGFVLLGLAICWAIYAFGRWTFIPIYFIGILALGCALFGLTLTCLGMMAIVTGDMTDHPNPELLPDPPNKTPKLLH